MTGSGKKWRRVGIVVMVLAASLQVTVIAIPETVHAYTPHPTIRIDSNANFTPANGVTGGDGTFANPFIIEGWEINGSAASGISIHHTDAHFVIRDCYIYSLNESRFDIFLEDVSNGTIRNNRVEGGTEGISLSDASNMEVTANDIISNLNGIDVAFALNVTIASNNVSASEYAGIQFQYAPGIVIKDNHLINSMSIDIRIWYTTGASLMNNTMTPGGNSRAGGISLSGDTPPHFDTHTIAANNTLNGKPILYYKKCSNEIVDRIPAGQLIFANCTDIRVANMTMETSAVLAIGIFFTNGAIIADNVVSNSHQGIYFERSSNMTAVSNTVADSSWGIDLYESTNATMTGNTAFSNGNGASIWFSDSCTVAGNNISDSEYAGISTYRATNLTIAANNITSVGTPGVELYESTDVAVYHNNFFNNSIDGTDDMGIENRWDNGYPSGGNYWSDFAGPDFYKGVNQDQPGSDGIGDVPFTLDSDSRDAYPLMVPYGIFDTLPPTVAIASPIEGQTLTAAPITASGSSSDTGGSGLSRVEVRTNGGGWSIASGTTSWTDSIGLVLGPNLIEARSWDRAGNPSSIASVNVTYNNTPPNALFTVTPTEGNVSTTFLVDASSSSDLEDPTADLSVRWDWENDSVWDTALTTTKTGQHIYGLPGNYTIRLEVWDTGGLFNSTTRQVNVTPESVQPTLPLEPENLQAVGGNGQVDLSWTSPSSDGGSPITNYIIYRGTTSGSETFLVRLGSVLSYTDLGLANGITYYYTVAAINGVGHGPNSTEANATPATTPSEPLNLAAIAGDGQVTLTWTAPISDGGLPIMNYTLYRGTASGGETLLMTLGNLLTYSDTGLANGQTYYYRVSASNSVGEGPKSTEVNATPATIPSEPLNIVATTGGGQVTISWAAPASDGGSPITNYTVYRGTTSDGEMLLATLGNVLAYTDMSVTNGQTYYYKVTASNRVGEGPFSTEVSALPTSGTQSGKSILGEMWFWLVIVAVVVVIVLAAVLVLRKKRKDETGPERDEDDQIDADRTSPP